MMLMKGGRAIFFPRASKQIKILRFKTVKRHHYWKQNV